MASGRLGGMNETPTDLVALPALARRLKIPAAWLKEETAAGRIPHLRAGRRLLFNVEAVKRCLLARAAGDAEGGDA